jgi:dienelactone hydrolase
MRCSRTARRRAGTIALLAASIGAVLPLGGLGAQTAPAALDCTGDAGDPDPATDPDAWRARDQQNLACATQRQQDELTNLAFLRTWAIESGAAYGDVLAAATQQLSEPTRPHASATYWATQSEVGDPFRMPDDWEAAGRGQTEELTFVSKTGAHLAARLYSPNPSLRERRLPGVVFTPGLQSYNEVNSWIAQGLAESGYIVLIIDPQGQGDSENLPHNPDGSINCTTAGCPNTPTNDFPETESAIDFILSNPTAPYRWAIGVNAAGTAMYNPLWARLDPNRIGIGGHSLGAIAATPIGQLDPRVKAIVSYDNLDNKLDGAALVAAHAPTLFFSVDYEFPSVLTPKDPASPPDPREHLGDFDRLAGTGVDTMSITTRASTHYEWGYQPFPASFPATRYGERVSFHYTLAWFDRYLKGDKSATNRLVALTYDGSADASSIGAGTFDETQSLADPTNPGAGNVPYKIAGKCAANMLSFYYDSAYSLEGGKLRSDDMRARGCAT